MQRRLTTGLILTAILLCLGSPTWAEMSVVMTKGQTINITHNPLAGVDSKKILAQAPNLQPKVLKYGLEAYKQAALEGLDKKGIITLVDFAMPDTQKRLWVIDLNTNKVLFHTLVAHGEKSGRIYARHFSNKFNSHESSLGAYITGGTFVGNLGYSMRIYGITPGYDTNAYNRDIVVHGAWYASEKALREYGHLGWTWGCFGIAPKWLRPIIHTIEHGTLILAYYPNQQWLKQAPFIPA